MSTDATRIFLRQHAPDIVIIEPDADTSTVEAAAHQVGWVLK